MLDEPYYLRVRGVPKCVPQVCEEPNDRRAPQEIPLVRWEGRRANYGRSRGTIRSWALCLGTRDIDSVVFNNGAWVMALPPMGVPTQRNAEAWTIKRMVEAHYGLPVLPNVDTDTKEPLGDDPVPPGAG